MLRRRRNKARYEATNLLYADRVQEDFGLRRGEGSGAEVGFGL